MAPDDILFRPASAVVSEADKGTAATCRAFRFCVCIYTTLLDVACNLDTGAKWPQAVCWCFGLPGIVQHGPSEALEP